MRCLIIFIKCRLQCVRESCIPQDKKNILPVISQLLRESQGLETEKGGNNIVVPFMFHAVSCKHIPLRYFCPLWLFLKPSLLETVIVSVSTAINYLLSVLWFLTVSLLSHSRCACWEIVLMNFDQSEVVIPYWACVTTLMSNTLRQELSRCVECSESPYKAHHYSLIWRHMPFLNHKNTMMLSLEINEQTNMTLTII